MTRHAAVTAETDWISFARWKYPLKWLGNLAMVGGVVGIFPVNSGGYHGMTGYVDNIERMIKAVGVDHVGIGTDMDGISPPSFVAYDDYAEWPSVTGALLARGYSRDDVAKVAGGNFLRVFDEVIAT